MAATKHGVEPPRDSLNAARGLVLAAAFASALAPAACAAPHLLDERSTSPYAELLAARDALPQTEVALDASAPGRAPTRVVADEVLGAARDGRPVLVLLNGVFSGAQSFRFLVGPLGATHDLLVMDLPGTGRSEARDPSELEPSAYTPQWLGDRVYRALRDWQSRQPSPRRIVLVGHSVAGTAVLRMLGDPGLRELHAATRARVVGAVLLAPADVAADRFSPTLEGLARVTSFEIGFGDFFGFLRPRVDRAIARSVLRPDADALAGEADRFATTLVDGPRRRASQAMLLRLRPTLADGSPDWRAIADVAADHARVDVPTLVLWGREDDTLPLAMGEKLTHEIPGAGLVVVDAARHSFHQERSAATSAAILAFASSLGSPPAEAPSAAGAVRARSPAR